MVNDTCIMCGKPLPEGYGCVCPECVARVERDADEHCAKNVNDYVERRLIFFEEKRKQAGTRLETWMQHTMDGSERDSYETGKNIREATAEWQYYNDIVGMLLGTVTSAGYDLSAHPSDPDEYIIRGRV